MAVLLALALLSPVAANDDTYEVTVTISGMT